MCFYLTVNRLLYFTLGTSTRRAAIWNDRDANAVLWQFRGVEQPCGSGHLNT